MPLLDWGRLTDCDSVFGSFFFFVFRFFFPFIDLKKEGAIKATRTEPHMRGFRPVEACLSLASLQMACLNAIDLFRKKKCPYLGSPASAKLVRKPKLRKWYLVLSSLPSSALASLLLFSLGPSRANFASLPGHAFCLAHRPRVSLMSPSGSPCQHRAVILNHAKTLSSHIT
jgi:hypothetical protein